MKNAHRSFPIGATVQLNSGGLEFTIESIKGDKATVRWTESQRVRKETFPIAMLRRVHPPKVSHLEAARRIAFVLDKAAREKPGFSATKHSSLDGKIKHILADSKKSPD